MPQVSLVNRSGITIKIGDYVKLHPTFKDAFVFADYWDVGIIGNATQQASAGRRCVINLMNTISYTDIIGVPPAPNVFGEEFETVSKNLKTYPYTLTNGVDGVSDITYDIGGGLSVIKTFHYTLGILDNITLSGDTPTGIKLTKTFHYIGDELISVTYS